MKAIGLRLIIVVVGLGAGSALAEGSTGAHLLARAMRSVITLNHSQEAEKPIFVRHCRTAKAGCDSRIQNFARYFVQAGDKYQVDPWLLAAMAFRESSFNPFATGSVGERGLLQMHPKSPWARKLRFVKDENYRERCRRKPGACQQEIVDGGADLLARSVRLCDGDIVAALGSYNTGRCGGNPDYARKVFKAREQLRESVGLSSNSDHVSQKYQPKSAQR